MILSGLVTDLLRLWGLVLGHSVIVKYVSLSSYSRDHRVSQTEQA
jgi:hypothetical protein